jgi:allophanate hydrolase subunit 2
MIAVRSWGVAGSIRDGGTIGRAALGVPRGGAVDAWSHALGNRLVGNVESAAGFESSGGLDVEIIGTRALVTITGATCDLTVHDGPAIAWGTPTLLPSGARLRIGRLRDGARVYLAVRGGVTIERESTTDLVRVGAHAPHPPAAVSAVPLPAPDRVALWPGPRRDWFDTTTWSELCGVDFVVSAMSDRVGVRLSGPELRRVVTRELPSEGLVEGSVQVPPDGDPIVMLADHPTTGGYPVIGVVDPAHLRYIAQLSAGATVRFRAMNPLDDRPAGDWQAGD